MGEPARKLEEPPPQPPPRGRLTVVSSAPEVDEDEVWVLEAIMACYCTVAVPR
ncbi:MAG: hypothetical protein QN117_08575 [Armatimonadota bacterium]|nr:hypothetical protein [Armatimonadota bacterium]MDR7451564.1 hypothetical protein [Armatimonadota bacterium]MDR7467531.1 hypothetical protein [Armatimonadota bacterium]MDR7494405.1 hypothetical protein [Armatimonadota bacterium]MDR7499222.1 hypothetical protein [Armatimonadota bacterium]